jgi:hypothetical protein
LRSKPRYDGGGSVACDCWAALFELGSTESAAVIRRSKAIRFTVAILV